MNTNLYNYTLNNPYFSDEENMWVITRYKDVKQLLHSELLSNNLYITKIKHFNELDCPAIDKIKMLWLNSFDLPEHRKPRKVFDALLSNKQIHIYKEEINNIALREATSLSNLKEFDLIEKYATHYL